MKEFTCYKKKSFNMSLDFDLSDELVNYINEQLKQYIYLNSDISIQLTYNEVHDILTNPDGELYQRAIGIMGHLQLSVLGRKVENLIGDYLMEHTEEAEWIPGREVEWSEIGYIK